MALYIRLLNIYNLTKQNNIMIAYSTTRDDEHSEAHRKVKEINERCTFTVLLFCSSGRVAAKEALFKISE